jgi:hypothetical protein
MRIRIQPTKIDADPDPHHCYRVPVPTGTYGTYLPTYLPTIPRYLPVRYRTYLPYDLPYLPTRYLGSVPDPDCIRIQIGAWIWIRIRDPDPAREF